MVKIIRGMKINSSMRIDNTLSKLRDLSAEVVAEPLASLMNNTMLDDVNFPDGENK